MNESDSEHSISDGSSSKSRILEKEGSESDDSKSVHSDYAISVNKLSDNNSHNESTKSKHIISVNPASLNSTFKINKLKYSGN